MKESIKKTKEELKKDWEAEEKIAHIHGWDFSHIKGRFESKENELPWKYEDIIHSYMKQEDEILDIDTGGGEVLLGLHHSFTRTSATEGYPPNVELCKKELLPLGIDFHEMSDYSKMPFCDERFDLVINRHGKYDAKELYRVLKPGGLFITQQVGEDNERELVELLLPGAKKEFQGMNRKEQTKVFEEAGFSIVQSEEAFRPIRFYDVGALVWFAHIIQ